MSHKDAQSSFISMGYRAEEAGQYTIALENPEDLLEYENVLLHDNLTNTTTNLLYATYTFDTERTQDDGRFTIQFIGRHNTATDIANIYSFYHNAKLSKNILYRLYICDITILYIIHKITLFYSL